MYKVFLVLGGESSGTRLTTKFLLNAGVFGTADHRQDYDVRIPDETPFVWRRSFPHDRVFPDIAVEMLHPLMESGIISDPKELMVLMTTRNWLCAESSAVEQSHSYDLDEAHYRNQEGYKYIFRFLSHFSCDYELVPMEAFIYSKVFYVPYLYERCGLDVPYMEQKQFMDKIEDTNEKHLWRYLNDKRQKEVRDETNKAGEFSTKTDRSKRF